MSIGCIAIGTGNRDRHRVSDSMDSMRHKRKDFLHTLLLFTVSQLAAAGTLSPARLGC